MSKRKKAIRESFRDAVFTRDRYKCKICGSTYDLDAHHIINRKKIKDGGYILENGITLCKWHHFVAEQGILPISLLYRLIKERTL